MHNFGGNNNGGRRGWKVLNKELPTEWIDNAHDEVIRDKS